MTPQLVTCHLCLCRAALNGWGCVQGPIFSQSSVKRQPVRLSWGQLWGTAFFFWAVVQLHQQWWGGLDGGESRISATDVTLSIGVGFFKSLRRWSLHGKEKGGQVSNKTLGEPFSCLRFLAKTQESEPSQEKGAGCDPAELVYGAGKGNGDGWIPQSGREGGGKRCTFHCWPGEGGVLSTSCCCGEPRKWVRYAPA